MINRIFHPIIILCLMVGFNVYAQGSLLDMKVSVTAENVTLPDLLLILEKETDIQFFYPHSILPKNYKVNIKVKDYELNKVLESVLGGTSLVWKEINGMIAFTKSDKKEILFRPQQDMTNQINVINVYDTIVAYRYDTITNIVYDTLLIIDRDTIVYKVYEYDKPVTKQFLWGIYYQRDLFGNKPVNNLEYNTEYYNKSESYISSQSLFTSIGYMRNSLQIFSGLKIKKTQLSAMFKYPEYSHLYKDTTEFFENTISDYISIGEDTIWTNRTLWYDSTYAVIYDSTMEPVSYKQSKKLYYLSIPLEVGYKIYNRNNLYLYARVGAMINFNINYKKNINILPKVFADTKYKMVYFCYYAGISAEYSISKNLNLATAIYYNRQNSNRYRALNQDETYLYNLKFRIGMEYVIK